MYELEQDPLAQASASHPLAYRTLVERLFLHRYGATALAQERAFPQGVPALVGVLVVLPDENQQQEEHDGG